MGSKDHPDRVPPLIPQDQIIEIRGEQREVESGIGGLENRKKITWLRSTSNKYDALGEDGYVIGLCPVIN